MLLHAIPRYENFIIYDQKTRIPYDIIVDQFLLNQKLLVQLMFYHFITFLYTAQKGLYQTLCNGMYVLCMTKVGIEGNSAWKR